MTDRTQFEAMLEALINEDQEKAKDIFHNIVVAKSREIYEELLAEDFDLYESEDKNPEDTEHAEDPEKPVDEASDENPFADSEEEGEEEEEEEEEEEGEEDDVGGDAGDDFVSDVEDDGDLEDRVMDLEDALDELKAEFEQLMADEGDAGGDMSGMDDMPMGGDSMGDDELNVSEDDLEMPMMEYVNKVQLPKHGDNGVNTKSAVASKNDMGGTVKNIAQSKSESGVEANKGQLKGNGVFKGSKPQLQDAGNMNVPGGNAGKKGFTHKEPGHGAEKKGAGEKADNKKSTIGGKVR